MVLDCTWAYARREVRVVVIGWREWRVYRRVRRLPNLVVPDSTPQVSLHTSSHWFSVILQTESQHVVQAWWILIQRELTMGPCTTAAAAASEKITLLQICKKKKWWDSYLKKNKYSYKQLHSNFLSDRKGSLNVGGLVLFQFLSKPKCYKCDITYC